MTGIGAKEIRASPYRITQTVKFISYKEISKLYWKAVRQ